MKVMVRIRELVDARGWDIHELARQINADAETARNLYDGRSTQLDLEGLGRLSQALGVLPNEIVATVEEKQPSAADAPASLASHVPTEASIGQPTLEDPVAGKLDKLDAQEPINVAGQQMGYFPHSSGEPGIQMPHETPDQSRLRSEGLASTGEEGDEDRA